VVVSVRGVQFDTMKQACERLGISRMTMLRYLGDGFFTSPDIHRQGKGKKVRVFSDEWYSVNEPQLRSAREE
jgi:predicted site-specific integrase-resolvase